MQTQTLTGGFDVPPVQSAQAFRGIMEAMARPGTIHTLAGATPPAPLSPAAGAVLLTLCDPETPIFLAGAYDAPEVREWVAFHTGAPVSAAENCMFALGRWAELVPLDAYPIGSSEYPDRSATLIVEQDALTAEGATLAGPGIQDTAGLNLPEINVFQANHALFPLGLDFYFTSGDQIAALPRSTEVR